MSDRIFFSFAIVAAVLMVVLSLTMPAPRPL
jgi:hypothetical protein